MKILVLFYSTFGHCYKMALAAAEGAKRVEGAEVVIKRVPETLPPEVLEKMHAVQYQKAFAQVPICTTQELPEYDGFILGTPTRYGVMAAQMKAFWDATGSLWAKGALVGKPVGVYTGSSTPHGGQEATILNFHTLLLHHGMVIAGLPYTFEGISRVDEVTGGSPYGASYITGGDKDKPPTENELEGMRFQAEYIANLAARLSGS